MEFVKYTILHIAFSSLHDTGFTLTHLISLSFLILQEGGDIHKKFDFVLGNNDLIFILSITEI